MSIADLLNNALTVELFRRRGRTCTIRGAANMIVIALCVALAVAFAESSEPDIKPLDYRDEILKNHSNIDKRLLHRLTSILDANKTLNEREIQLINRTAHSLGVDKSVLTRLSDLVENARSNVKNGTAESRVASKVSEVPDSYNSYLDSGMPVSEQPPRVDESPDYASSVVLASDLLSLTSAVGNVEEQVCREQGYRFLDGLLVNKRWALRMFDASAKSPQGLLFGSSYHLGNFDECVGIADSADEIPLAGQYCLATIHWPEADHANKVRTGRGGSLRWAVCVPSACGAAAVQRFVGDVLSRTVGNTTRVTVQQHDCYTRKPLSVTKLDVAFLSLMLLFLVILLLSTTYEIVSNRRSKLKGGVVHDLVVSFSIVNNMKKILSTEQNTSLGLECIAGIKTLAMVFITAGHACLFIASGPVMDADAWDRLVRHPANAFMLNNALLVDTFLLLSAFLFCRLLLLELDKRRGRLNIIPILVFRYIRVTPAYLVVILFYMTWLPKIGEGPLWDERLQLEQSRCQASWWTNILYLNNYLNTDQLCMFQSWYLSVDTQMFFIAPLFIYPLWHWRRVGSTILGVAVSLSLVVPAIITFQKHWDPTLLFYAKEFKDIAQNYYFKEAYMKTHMKTTPYFMGLLIAYVLHRVQVKNYHFSRTFKCCAWAISITLGTATTFSVSVFYQPWYQYSTIDAAAYISLHKLAWGIANGWLIIACATGNGGVLGKLLTWKFWLPISRLTFCAYLVNGIIELYYIGTLRHPLHISFFNVMANAIAHIVLTFLLALLLCLTFESPIHGIEKILLRCFARPVLSDNARRESGSGESSRNTSQSRLE